MTPIVVVSGFPRSGSSLTMQMLQAGGMPCVGEYPAFEDMRVAPSVGVIDRGWWRSLAGQAVKVLEPTLVQIPGDVPAATIWLDRDLDEQVKSNAKFLSAVAGVRIPRGYARDLRAVFVRDRAPSIAALPSPPLLLRFEAILANPWAVAQALADHLGLVLDIDAMARAVVPRGPACLAGLLEAELLRRAEASA